jgi:hypothetical protein
MISLVNLKENHDVISFITPDENRDGVTELTCYGLLDSDNAFNFLNNILKASQDSLCY